MSVKGCFQPMLQRTLKTSIDARGVAVHNGERVNVRFRPAPPDTGVVFFRIDCDPVVSIPAHSRYVSDTRLSTCLSKDGARIATVEHLLSAVAGLGIDNMYVDINGPEMPIMDGSSAPFVFLLQSAGIEEQDAPKRFIKVLKTVAIECEDGRSVKVSPYDGFRVDFSIDFEHPVIRQSGQTCSLDFSSSSYITQISRARTFGLLKEVEGLRAQNLALGGSLDNTVVLGDGGVLNKEGLRYQDEFVRHKMLDAVGDLYLLGHALIGHFEGYKSGHDLNNMLIKKLLADKAAYELVSYPNHDTAPIALHPVLFNHMPKDSLHAQDRAVAQ